MKEYKLLVASVVSKIFQLMFVGHPRPFYRVLFVLDPAPLSRIQSRQVKNLNHPKAFYEDKKYRMRVFVFMLIDGDGGGCGDERGLHENKRVSIF